MHPRAETLREKPRAADDRPSVGVLPFANLSADPEQEFFCDGMAEEIINALAQVQGLRVVARRCAGEALTTKDPWVIPHRIMCPAIVPADPLVDDLLVSALQSSSGS